MSAAGLHEAIEDLISEHVIDVENAQEIRAVIAETNATGYHVDDWKIGSDADIDLSSDDEMRVPISFHLTGDNDHDSDRSFSGALISGNALVVIDGAGAVSFVDISGAVVDRTAGTDEDSGNGS
jgi:hypothetical protein